MRTSSTRRFGALSIVALLALVFSFASPALAGGKGGEKSGGPEKTRTPYVSGSTDDDSMPEQGTEPNAHPSGNDRHEDNGTQGMSTSDPDDNDRGPERTNGGPDKSFEGTDGSGGVDQADQDGNNGCGNDDDFEDDNEGWCGPKPKTDTPPTPPVDNCPKSGEMGNGNSNGNGPKKDCGEPECVEDMNTPAADCDDDEECTGTMAGGSTGGDDDECDEDDDDTDVLGEVITTCPKDGVLADGQTMPAGCTPTTPTGTVTSTNTAPGAVLASELQNAPVGEVLAGAEVLGVQLERTAPAGGGAAPAGTSVLGAALARTGLSFTILALAIALGLLAVGFLLKRAGRTTSDI